LPALVFDHNALFHVCQALGMCCLGRGMARLCDAIEGIEDHLLDGDFEEPNCVTLTNREGDFEEPRRVISTNRDLSPSRVESNRLESNCLAEPLLQVNGNHSVTGRIPTPTIEQFAALSRTMTFDAEQQVLSADDPALVQVDTRRTEGRTTWANPGSLPDAATQQEPRQLQSLESFLA